MAKTKISQYSATAADNTDISNINIAEGCSPANVNNAIRTLMAQLKDQQDGTSGDNFTVGGDLSVSGTATGVTPSSSDNSTKFATTAFVTTKVGSLGTMASQNATSVAITGGTIDGVAYTGGTLNNTPIGSTTPNTGAFTTISATTPIAASSGGTGLSSVGTSGNVLTSNGTAWTSSTLSAIGVGQTYQSLTSSRAVDTSYTNSTSKPILVIVALKAQTGGDIIASVTVDGVTFGHQYIHNGSSVDLNNVTFIVPVGSTYSVSSGGYGSGALYSWAELR